MKCCDRYRELVEVFYDGNEGQIYFKFKCLDCKKRIKLKKELAVNLINSIIVDLTLSKY